MPAITARSAKKSVSYHDLYNLSTADLLFDEKKKKRRPASKIYHCFFQFLRKNKDRQRYYCGINGRF